MMVDGDGVRAAANVPGRGSDEISAVATHIDAAAELAGAVLHAAAGMPKQDVFTTPARQKPPRVRERTMPPFEGGQRLVALVARIDVQGNETADGAGGNADAEATIPEPRLDDR